MLEPKKPGEGGGDPSDPAQQNDTAKQVDGKDMSTPSDGDSEPQQPAA
jgi:hypothetical protein